MASHILLQIFPSNNRMTAQVIPLLRSPRGKEFFDYNIPSTCAVQCGSMVRIPFRNKTIWGIVKETQQQSDQKKLREITECLPEPYALTPTQYAFLQWFADYYYISSALAAKTILTPPPLQWRAYPLNALPIKTALQNRSSARIIRVWNRVDAFALYKKIIQSREGATLIITPEYHDVTELAHALRRTEKIIIHAISRPLTPRKNNTLLRAIQQSTNDEHHVIIGTRRLIFFPWEYCTNIIIDQEEEKSHKQFDHNPRYHVRDVALKLFRCSRQNEIHLAFTSHAPSLALRSSSLPMMTITRSWNTQHIHVVNMENEKKGGNYSWFSDVLKESINTSRKTLLFLNRTGTFRVAVCRDCETLLSQDTIKCSSCGSARIVLRGKGIAQLEKECQELFPTKHITRIDRERDDPTIQEQAQKSDIVIATERIFRVLPLQHFNHIGILSVDHLLVYPHWQAHERVFQLLVKIFATEVPLTLQTHAPNHPIIRAAVANNYQLFRREELVVRKELHLPPFHELFELYDHAQQKQTTMTTAPDIKTLSPSIIVDRSGFVTQQMTAE